MEVMKKDTNGKLDFVQAGFAVDTEPNKEELILENEKATAQINAEKLFNNSGLPTKYRGIKLSEITLDKIVYGPENRSFNSEIVNQFINDVAEGKSRFLWLCGKPGTGKTTLAAAIVKELCYRQKSSRYFKSHEIMQRLEDSKRYSAKENVQMVVKDVVSTSFVVIDEIGRWPITDWEKFRIFEITNQLYENYKSAIFISNMTRVELSSFMGLAAVDRFLEGGKTVDFQGESYRGKNNELYTR